MKRLIILPLLLAASLFCHAIIMIYVGQDGDKYGFYIQDGNKEKFIVPRKYYAPRMSDSYAQSVHPIKGSSLKDNLYLDYTDLVLFDGKDLVFFNPKGKPVKTFSGYVTRYKDEGLVSSESGVYDVVTWKLIVPGSHLDIVPFELVDFETGEKKPDRLILIQSEDKSHYRLYKSPKKRNGELSEDPKNHQLPELVNDIRYEFTPGLPAQTRLIRDRFLMTNSKNGLSLEIHDMATGQANVGKSYFYLPFPTDSLTAGSAWVQQCMLDADHILVLDRKYNEEGKRYGALNLATGEVTAPYFDDTYKLMVEVFGRDFPDYVARANRAMADARKPARAAAGLASLEALIADPATSDVPAPLRRSVEDFASSLLIQLADSAILRKNDVEAARDFARRSAIWGNSQGQAYMGFIAEHYNNDTIAAIEWYKPAAAAHYPQAVYRLAILTYENGQYDLAFPYLLESQKRLVSKAEGYPYRLYLAQSYRLGRGTMVDMREYYLQLAHVKGYEPIYAEIRENLPAVLDNPDGYFLDDPESEMMKKYYLSDLWGLLAGVKPEVARYQYMAGYTYEQTQNLNDDRFGHKKEYIAEHYKAAHDLEPDNAEYAAAYKRFEDVIKLKEGDISVDKARQLAQDGKYNSAIEMLQKILRILPKESLNAYVAMAKCYYAMGNDQMTIDAAKSALAEGYSEDAIRIHNMAVDRINSNRAQTQAAAAANAASVAQLMEASAQFLQAGANLVQAIGGSNGHTHNHGTSTSRPTTTTVAPQPRQQSSSYADNWEVVPCSFCGGTGVSPLCTYGPRFANSPQEYCKTCRRVDDIHTHLRCNVCNGKGTVKRRKR